MALTQSLVTAGRIPLTVDAASFNISIPDPGTACALVVLLGYIDGNTANQYITTVAGGGLTWTVTHGSTNKVAYSAHSAVATAVIGGSGPGAFTLTVNATGNFNDNTGYYGVVKYQGHSTVVPFAAPTCQDGRPGNGAVTLTLGAAPTAADYAVGITWCDNGSGSGGATPATGWTELDSHTGDGQAYGCGNIVYRTGSTSTSMAWDDVNPVNASNFSSAQAAVIVKITDSSDSSVSIWDGDEWVQSQPTQMFDGGSWATVLDPGLL